ncbi:hypothetical protein BV22DRAFT_398871 [Leucogyrophana mollusca]|uniref:Uncharacterized protein n=1 Tax=Leucogyrophana mollusca TaxID=85980 RepID=A0ACB8BKC2_9AGAM|nr:hypothetical protein BV22DRAFT_398871 [Leucogyrophana mollusca]
MSSLISLSVQQQTSVAYPNLPPPGVLDPFVLHGRSDGSLVTACLWIEETDLDATLTWASHWPGPVSLVLVTSSLPESVEYASLLRRLPGPSGSMPPPSHLSLHVLHVHSSFSGSTNAYLNLARLLSQTPQVIIFPGGPPGFLSADDQRLFLGKVNSRVTLNRPIIVVSETLKTYPFRPLSPVVLASDHPIWCTERYFLLGSRSLDWEECLWQLWLEAFGDVSLLVLPSRPIANVTTEPSSYVVCTVLMFAQKLTCFQMKTRRRWSYKFRMEACVLASKRSQALETFNKKNDKKRLHWRRRLCRENSICTFPTHRHGQSSGFSLSSSLCTVPNVEGCLPHSAVSACASGR